MKHRQRGMTLIGFLITLAVVGFAAYIGMQLFPMYMDYYTVRSVSKSLSQQSGVADMDPSAIQASLFKRLDINQSENVTAKNLEFTRLDNGWQMHVKYEVRRPIIGNLDVVGKFDFTQDLTRGGGGAE